MPRRLTPECLARVWKPGQSGNPKGRKPGVFSIAEMLTQYGAMDTPEGLTAKLREKLPKLPKTLKLGQALWLTVFMQALKGESWAVEFVANRTEGKVKDNLAIEAEGLNIIIGGLPKEIPPESL